MLGGCCASAGAVGLLVPLSCVVMSCDVACDNAAAAAPTHGANSNIRMKGHRFMANGIFFPLPL